VGCRLRPVSYGVCLTTVCPLSPIRQIEQMRMVAGTYWTADMVRALPNDGKRYETVYGELLVSRSPGVTHQIVLGRLFVALYDFVMRERVGSVLCAPADISWQREDVLVQPDVFIAPLEQLRTSRWSEVVHLLYAAEVLGRSSTRQDRFTKRRLYQEMRVGEYWVVDREAHVVEIWTPEAVFPRVEQHEVVWQPAGAAEALRIDVEGLLAPV
jgi:Uma2 family endonuclease